MNPIHPITHLQCKPYYGKPICAIMNDGTEIVGTLSRVDGNKLILNDDTAAEKNRTKTRSKKSKALLKSKVGRQALTAAFPGGPYPSVNPFARAMVLDPAAIALLFPLV